MVEGIVDQGKIGRQRFVGRPMQKNKFCVREHFHQGSDPMGGIMYLGNNLFFSGAVNVALQQFLEKPDRTNSSFPGLKIVKTEFPVVMPVETKQRGDDKKLGVEGEAEQQFFFFRTVERHLVTHRCGKQHRFTAQKKPDQRRKNISRSQGGEKQVPGVNRRRIFGFEQQVVQKSGSAARVPDDENGIFNLLFPEGGIEDIIEPKKKTAGEIKEEICGNHRAEEQKMPVQAEKIPGSPKCFR